jgi:hypothetical protein
MPTASMTVSGPRRYRRSGGLGVLDFSGQAGFGAEGGAGRLALASLPDGVGDAHLLQDGVTGGL